MNPRYWWQFVLLKKFKPTATLYQEKLWLRETKTKKKSLREPRNKD